MKKRFTFILAALIFLSLPKISFSQLEEVSFSSGPRINLGPQFEYFGRTLAWGDEEYTSNLKSLIIGLNVEIAINDGFSISGLAGYASSDYDALIFRELPFSIELDVGSLGGFILGADIKKSVFYIGNIQCGLHGQFLYNIGNQETWDVPGLNVSGTVTGKPTWMRASVGGYIKFEELGSIVPYLAVYYNNLWGQFEMEQTIQTLEGTEEQKLQSKGLIDITLGSIFTLSDRFTLKGELHVLPYTDGMDLGIVASAAYSF
jgi:hypothetical protein